MTSVLAAPPSFSAVPVPHGQEDSPFLPSVETTNPTTTKHEASASTLHRGTIDASLNFYSPPTDGSPPHNYVEKPPAGQPQKNFGEDARTIPIHDARGSENTFHIDAQAFALVQNEAHNPSIDWSSDDSVRSTYYPEVEALLLRELKGANRILLFDHTVRRATPNAHRAPVTRAHIDQTPKSAAQRVRFHLPEEADELLQGRYRIVNVWRPINGAVEQFPLAFADSATVDDGDMVGVEHRYPDRTGETAGVRYSEGQKWWYWSGMEDDERILLQCFDSAAPMNRVPHSAFVDPRTGEEAKPRESIEVRALVFG